jgi:hypothetical protein
MKQRIKQLIKKHYPPVVMSILIALILFAVAALLGIIEYYTTNLPIQYQ